MLTTETVFSYGECYCNTYSGVHHTPKYRLDTTVVLIYAYTLMNDKDDLIRLSHKTLKILDAEGYIKWARIHESALSHSMCPHWLRNHNAATTWLEAKGVDTYQLHINYKKDYAIAKWGSSLNDNGVGYLGSLRTTEQYRIEDNDKYINTLAHQAECVKTTVMWTALIGAVALILNTWLTSLISDGKQAIDCALGGTALIMMCLAVPTMVITIYMDYKGK